jgi:photosystem II stability/assembly factor-like uncharacterized protein
MGRGFRRTRVTVLAALLAGAVVVSLLLTRQGESATPRGPNALLVHRTDAARLLLAADDGVFESLDSGRSWRRSGLEGNVVAALARVKDGTVWAGGTGFLARSSDGGRSWAGVRSPGLPSLDVRALSASRDVGQRLEAAVEGEGLFRSNDGGKTFAKLGLSQTGSDAFALVETVDGVIFVSDRRLGVAVNGDGDGADWIEVLDEPVLAIAPNYSDRHNALLLAATRGGLLRTTDKGLTWDEVLPLRSGAAGVAFSQSRVELAFAVAGDGTMFRSDDFGATWAPVD